VSLSSENDHSLKHTYETYEKVALQIHILLLQSSVSHDPSEIILIWWLAYQCWKLTVLLLHIFVEETEIFVSILW